MKNKPQSPPTALTWCHQVFFDFKISPVVAVASPVVSRPFAPADRRLSFQFHQDTFHFGFFSQSERDGPSDRVSLRKRLLCVQNIVNQMKVFDPRHFNYPIAVNSVFYATGYACLCSQRDLLLYSEAPDRHTPLISLPNCNNSVEFHNNLLEVPLVAISTTGKLWEKEST